MSYVRCQMSYVKDVRLRDLFAGDMFPLKDVCLREKCFLEKRTLRRRLDQRQISDIVFAFGRCPVYRRLCFREMPLSKKCPSKIGVHFAEISAFENCLP